MSTSDKKKQFVRGGAAIASVAGIIALALFAKQFFDKKKSGGTDNNSKTQSKSQKLTKLNRLSPPLPKGYLGAKIELPEYYQKLLKQLPEPKLLYKHFMTCLSTPRPSHKLDKMRKALKDTAEALNIAYTQDKAGNVCLKKNASKGYENAPGVVVQCHMDMVCTKADDCKFDFDTEGVQPYIEGQWLKAKKTTLGADDGIGIASGLALMEHPNLVHGPLELLITVDEETTMGGATNLEKYPFLRNKILINVDSEESNRICIGCAGGFNKEFTVNMDRVSMDSNSIKDYKVYTVNISGLCGGHTGIQIHLGRANAIQLLVRILTYLISEKKIELQMIDINGGNAMNAIPNSANCTIVIPNKTEDIFAESVQEYWLNYVLTEFKDIESKMHMDFKAVQFEFGANKVCDIQSTNVLVALMNNLPNGVLRMSPSVDGLVQTSVAFSELGLDSESSAAVCGLLARSMSMNELKELNRKIDSLNVLFGAKCGVKISECSNMFPGWDPVVSSPALNNCKNAHIALFGSEADVYAVHAGLECGLIKDIYPQMDCVSIGPCIKGAHSTDEKLELATVPIFYDWLVETITRIAQQKS